MTLTVTTKRYVGGSKLATGELAGDVRALIDDITAVIEAATGPTVNGVIDGLTLSNPTTPSSQAAGTGNTTWRCNAAAGIVAVDSVEKAEAAQADFSVHSGSCLLSANQEVWARIVEKNVTGTLSTVAVKGTPAAAGASVAPTDAEVTAAVAVATWTELGRIKLARDATTTLTATYSHRYRHMQGVKDLADVVQGIVKG